MRRFLPYFGMLAVAAIVAIGLIQSGDAATEPEAPAEPATISLAAALKQLEGAPPELAAVHAKANDLIAEDQDAFRTTIASLEGRPIVLNKWASWCGPCRAEFPFFQTLAAKLGKDVAFLGLNAGDNTQDASAFLEEFPVSYPSFEDPDEKIARTVKAPGNYPITVFYGADNKIAFVHQGGYASEAALERDVRRYAIG